MFDHRRGSFSRGDSVERGCGFEVDDGSLSFDPSGFETGLASHIRMLDAGVSITMHTGPSSLSSEPDDLECQSFVTLFHEIIARTRPDVVIGYGGDRLMRSVFEHARRDGINTVFVLHTANYTDPSTFKDIDAIVVPSSFAANHYRDRMGIECAVITHPVDHSRVFSRIREPKYLTFVNPSLEKGVFAFVKIADELGRRRPDIPILVVESRGTEQSVAACGIDLRPHGNVFFMAQTADPRRFWQKSRVCLIPSVCQETMGLVAVEAIINGIPVVGSDRGALPETIGGAGTLLPLPDRLTPTSRELPTSEEVCPWVEEVVRLWDDPLYYEDRRLRCQDEARRWDPSVVEPMHVRFLEALIRPRKSSA